MTRILLPRMVSSDCLPTNGSSSRGKGIIINISSVADRKPYPYLAVYAATKAFVRSFSVAVGTEYRSKGVIVQTVSPFLVETNMTYPLRKGLLVVSAEDFARQALDTLGLTSETTGCLSHAIQCRASKSLKDINNIIRERVAVCSFLIAVASPVAEHGL
ncbi:hypothetical protein MJG53_013472 [Ovis ammon polii x Ovis aries]|uniref:Uncharacterized protein n=1 Tax=Ovis ammon polii x Ovis aries TaxID=2918886 RepID=A0ACB9UJL9_9CETA|nr:hypothetical protein MJG53_013472 [Ovis ammon polii x Ovis aries]